MYHSQQKELESLFKASQIKIWPNLNSWTWLQRPDLSFEDLYHSHFFYFYTLWLTLGSKEILIENNLWGMKSWFLDSKGSGVNMFLIVNLYEAFDFWAMTSVTYGESAAKCNFMLSYILQHLRADSASTERHAVIE